MFVIFQMGFQFKPAKWDLKICKKRKEKRRRKTKMIFGKGWDVSSADRARKTAAKLLT